MQRRVLMIVADDWSPIARCYGYPSARTPHVDALAERAVVFDRAFCPSPSCAASRACMLSGLPSHQHGQYGHCHGVHHFRTLDAVVSLPAICAQHGVRAELIGKNHTSPATVYPWAKHTWLARPAPGEWRREVGRALACDQSTFTMVAPLYPHRGGRDGWHCDDLQEDFADRPVDPAEVPVPDFLPDLPEVRRDLAGYWRAIGRFDACVGATLDALAEHPDADNTLVMVLSDHGMPFPGAKASSYDAGHRCPLLVARPGSPAGRCATAVSWLDLLPTVCDWLDLPLPADAFPRTGQSLLAMLDRAPESRTIFASHTFHEVTMYDPYRFAHDGRWKFVQQLNHHAPLPMASDIFSSPTWKAVRGQDVMQLGKRQRQQYVNRLPEALYDTLNDPMETRDVSGEHPQIARQLRDALMQHRIQTRDPWLMLDHQRGDASIDLSMVER
jgi:N-sulfoglucosamine sulfohydrolase